MVTADQAVRNGKTIDLKRTVDEALRRCPQVTNVLVQRRTGAGVVMDKKRDAYLEDEISSVSSNVAGAILDAQHPLFMLYTSGSTGKPKGIHKYRMAQNKLPTPDSSNELCH